MKWCPECGFSLENGSQACPRCQAQTNSQDRLPTVIARFSNAAEAGYFAHEIASALDIDPEVSEHNDLDALGHAWTTTYVLKVPASHAQPAIRTLKELIAATSEEHGSSGLSGNSPESVAGEREFLDSGINWVPIVLTLAAGTFVLWAARRPAAEPQHARADELLKLMMSDSQPWTQTSANGRTVRQLSIDSVRNRITLEQDLDGDGLFDGRPIVIQVQ